MNITKIEWVKNPDGTPGYTLNPITGCLNHVDGMCKGGNFPCYAYRLANTRLRGLYLANNILPSHDEPDHEAHHADPFYPRFWPSKCDELYAAGGKAKGVFICDMSDLYGIGVPAAWTGSVMQTIRAKPDWRFYLLTKQPQNLQKWSPFPDNCWVGVTTTDNNTYLGDLLAIDAKVKYVSFEPLLKWSNHPEQKKQMHFILQRLGINWVIIGAQTKPYKPPKIEWVQEIVEAADKAGIPVFLKDNLKPLAELIAKFCGKGAWELRQEMPAGII